MRHAEKTIPPQDKGRATDFSEERSFGTEREAHANYKKAAARLLNVNEWHAYAGPGSSRFCLTNNLGEEVTGFAKEGFLFNIDLPVPGSDAGDGLEWVMVEHIEASGNGRTAEEYLSMTARPMPDPRKADPETAHFYNDGATSTFIVKRTGKTVSAAVHGRNEAPNNEDVDLHDKIRNTIVALSARIGLAGPQWKKLARGLLEPPDENQP
ncbi:MAG TPA: hypothetical protein VHS53_05840 [Mucilaginibacter sp.]|jgi:hypothetical protein|nr:hypothetical protein [Mucilaginibacter sp.]